MKEVVIEIVKRVFSLDQVPDDLTQDNCEKWDSMSILNLLVEIESEFDVSFEPEDIENMNSLGEILKKLEEYKK